MPPHDPPHASLPLGIVHPKKKQNRRDVDFGDLLPRLDSKAKKDGVKSAAIVRRALRAFLDGGSIADTSKLAEAVERLRQDMARIGGNLNQLAYLFNIDEPVHPEALASAHDELRHGFKEVVKIMRVVQNELLSKTR